MIHHMGICLFIAVGTNRTMIPQFSRDGFPEQLFAPFQPMTETCNNTAKKEFDEAAEIKGFNYLFHFIFFNANKFLLWKMNALCRNFEIKSKQREGKRNDF